VIVKGKVPVAVLASVITVSVEEFPETGLGEKVPVAPAGSPATGVVSAISADNPPDRAILIV
jgi:hypothetical protein